MKVKHVMLVKFRTHQESDNFRCLCGNSADEMGFFPCDIDGEVIEPEPETWDTHLWTCDRCDQMFYMVPPTE